MINRRKAATLILGGLSLVTLAGSLVPPPVSANPNAAPKAERGGAGPYLDIFLGSPAAPVTIIEYASFTCVHCGHFTREVMPALKREMMSGSLPG